MIGFRIFQKIVLIENKLNVFVRLNTIVYSKGGKKCLTFRKLKIQRLSKLFVFRKFFTPKRTFVVVIVVFVLNT